MIQGTELVSPRASRLGCRGCFLLVQLDAGIDLVWVGDPVTRCGVDLCPSEGGLFDERRHWIRLAREIIEPHGDLPRVETTDKSGPLAGGAVPEGDQGMLVTSGSLLDEAA
jgi:hypothetical protein